jgi:hypothetical protein
MLKAIRNIEPYLPICSRMYIERQHSHFVSCPLNFMAYQMLGINISTTVMSPKMFIQFKPSIMQKLSMLKSVECHV